MKDHLGNGYNFNFGVEVKVTPVIGIEGLYSFNGLGDKRISIPVSGTPGGATVPTDFFADMNMQYGTVNLVVQKPDGAVRPYGLVGHGRLLSAHQSDDARRGLCAGILRSVVVRLLPGGFVPVENVVGERSSTDFGMDFGGGVNFGAIYAEIRYHYIWGPTVAETGPVQPLPGVSAERKANGQFLATTFGFRF